jgi:hypothetical protein
VLIWLWQNVKTINVVVLVIRLRKARIMIIVVANGRKIKVPAGRVTEMISQVRERVTIKREGKATIKVTVEQGQEQGRVQILPILPMDEVMTSGMMELGFSMSLLTW